MESTPSASPPTPGPSVLHSGFHPQFLQPPSPQHTSARDTSPGADEQQTADTETMDVLSEAEGQRENEVQDRRSPSISLGKLKLTSESPSPSPAKKAVFTRTPPSPTHRKIHAHRRAYSISKPASITPSHALPLTTTRNYYPAPTTPQNQQSLYAQTALVYPPTPVSACYPPTSLNTPHSFCPNFSRRTSIVKKRATFGTFLLNPSVAAHLQAGGVVFFRSEDGRRRRLSLPCIVNAGMGRGIPVGRIMEMRA